MYKSSQRKKPRRDFYVSAAAPLWADCYPRGKDRARRFVEYLGCQDKLRILILHKLFLLANWKITNFIAIA